MKFKKTLQSLTLFEWCLWAVGIVVVTISFFFGEKNWLNLVASVLGVTSLIFNAKGLPIGQLLIMIFGMLYAVIAIQARYWSEVITYMGMTFPMALFAFISWLRHPHREGEAEVQIAHVTKRTWWVLSALTVVVTVAFYFILWALKTPQLVVSTVSIATSFLAASLLFLRSPYFALGYIGNDLVLIVLWGLKLSISMSYLPTMMCFVVFLFNDGYSFVNWLRMQKRQKREDEQLLASHS